MSLLKDLQLVNADEATITKYIFVVSLIEAQRAQEILDEEFITRYRAQTKKTALFREAIWQGICALKSEQHRDAKQLKDFGQLLFAFDGTTVLQGGAA